MELTIKLGRDDWSSFQSYMEKEVSRADASASDSFWVQLLLWAILGGTFIAIFESYSSFHWPTAISVGGLLIVLFVLFIYKLNRLKRLFAPSEAGPYVGEHKFKIDRTGIFSAGRGYNGFHSWALVKKIARKNGIIMVFIDTAFAYVFPEGQLEDADLVYRYMNECFDTALPEARDRPG